MLILLLVNILVSFSLFLSIMGIIFYGLRVLQLRKQAQSYYNITYFGFFLWIFLFYTGNLLGYNWISLVNPESTILVFNLISLIKTVNIAAIITFFFLALALKLEFNLTKSGLIVWSLLCLVGIIAFVSYLFVDLEILEIQNSIPLFGYNPPWVVNFSTLFALITGTWYGIQTVSEYRRDYQKKYGVSTYHYLFLIISLLAFVGLILSILFRLVFPLTSEFRALVFATTMLCLVMFPTLRWTYLQRYHQRKLEFERNTFIDIINHDLSNINHIILAILETSKEKGISLTEDDVKLLLVQIERMSSLIEKSRTSIRTGPVDRL
ncbi:hypothetical protein CEE45_10045 [Candidatus Heimdallarchaeota archaeon B3_Heim]|nr:MAG: hypothetical protein CEE45_10045 [Candidatus Heimdallarchaeota archaeon B3_Heim]